MLPDNNNNNQNVNIQNSNNNQNNQNTVMAGRTIPLEDALKLQERLAQHYSQAERRGRDMTSENKAAPTKVKLVDIWYLT